MSRAESLQRYIQQMVDTDAFWESGNLSGWIDQELGVDSTEDEYHRAAGLIREVNAAGEASIDDLLFLDGCYGFEGSSVLSLITFGDGGAAYICRLPGMKAEEVWAGWDIVAIVKDGSDPSAIGAGFIGICGDAGGEIVMWNRSVERHQLHAQQASQDRRADRFATASSVFRSLGTYLDWFRDLCRCLRHQFGGLRERSRHTEHPGCCRHLGGFPYS